MEDKEEDEKAETEETAEEMEAVEDDGGRRCGGEFGAECTCTAWYEMMEKSIGSGRVCRGRRRRCGDARCERYQCVFVLSNRIW